MPRWILLLVFGAGALALGATAFTTLESIAARAPASERTSIRSNGHGAHARFAAKRSTTANRSARWHAASPLRRPPWSNGADIDDARPRPFVDADAVRDASALASFDAAFAEESRDPQWGDATQDAIRTTLEATADAPVLERVDCRATLCKVELRGSADKLPTAAPFDGVAWWVEGEDGRAQVLLVREGAEIPLPTEE